MSEVGITGYGAYIPRLRLQRAAVFGANAWFAPGLKGAAKGERSFGDWDEDVVTLAVEAARDCVPESERPRLRSLVLASTTAPAADRQNAGVVKEALNLSDDTATWETSGGRRAGLAALLQALAAAPVAGETLCLAAEMGKASPASEAELTTGHAAAALTVGTSDAPVARLLGSHRVSVDFVDRFRAAGDDVAYEWEARWVRDEGYSKIAPRAIRAALEAAGVAGGDVAHFVLPGPKGAAAAVARVAGLPQESVRTGLEAEVGDSGAAHALLMLVHVLENAKPGERIVVAAFGGGCDVAVFERGAVSGHGGVARWLARRKPVSDYTKFLFFQGHLALEKGMRAEADQKQPLTALYRNRKAVMALVGGRCAKTGSVQFPRSDISVNPNDHAFGTQEDYPLAERPARILTHTADSLTYTPSPPAYYGMVEFDGGGRLTAEFADVEPEDVEVGRPMRMVFRVKARDEQRGFTKYFWKASPAA